VARTIDTAALRRLYPDDPILEAVFDHLDTRLAVGTWVHELQDSFDKLGMLNELDSDWHIEDVNLHMQQDHVDATMFGSSKKTYVQGETVVIADVKLIGRKRRKP
jgi:hypothetical protein